MTSKITVTIHKIDIEPDIIWMMLKELCEKYIPSHQVVSCMCDDEQYKVMVDVKEIQDQKIGRVESV